MSVYAHGDGCDAMHACVEVLFALHEAYGHGDGCEATYACACFCVWACTRRMLTETMHHACVCGSVLMHKAHAHSDCCEAMRICKYVYAYIRCMRSCSHARYCVHVCYYEYEPS